MYGKGQIKIEEGIHAKIVQHKALSGYRVQWFKIGFNGF